LAQEKFLPEILQLQQEKAELVRRCAELEQWRDMAFKAHPNIDLDIEYHQRSE
jgi:hypothetical protein